MMLAAAGDHVVKHRIKRQLVLARPPRDQPPDVGAVTPDEDRRRLRPAMPWLGGKKPEQVTVVSLRRREGVERLPFLVVFGQRLAELMQRIETLPCRHQWPLPGDFVHQLVDI